MKYFYAVAICIFFANGVIQMAVGLKCDSGCAACWLDNNNDGQDTKFTCMGDRGSLVHCGDVCPTGYHGIHCAKIERCLCGPQGNCDEFGPCQCTAIHNNGYLYCGSLDGSGSGACQTS
ncbi:hypothetical protein K443DRAFT_428433 [Laccaria amethystina LaAM-08-1]|uniref:EGF-like domain-containing protein n=1 Tax=Laccaria amethystina LaAM-08-1 TaxID=1095629 RepID=A0A0C9WP92_9AGAR|nr:hypothetical protein K443DRAFT_428433 [Laccaria amethystina LaAM-08-1]